VLVEEIDTAGIKPENTMTVVPEDGLSSAENDPESENEESRRESRKKAAKKAVKKEKKQEPPCSRITLGALLKFIDGPGAKEGRLLVFTTNSPKSLNSALVRPGRIDRRIFLGKSSKLVASITSQRIFGTDPRLKGKSRKQEMDRMAKQFGELMPANTFSPGVIQKFCQSHRGKPERAIKELPQWIKDELRGAHEFKYDIRQSSQDGVLMTSRRIIKLGKTTSPINQRVHRMRLRPKSLQIKRRKALRQPPMGHRWMRRRAPRALLVRLPSATRSTASILRL
jgi:hypothetical protein